MQLDNNISKETKGLFLLSNPIPYFIVPINIHIVEWIIHVQTLIDIGATTCFVDENFVTLYLQPL